MSQPSNNKKIAKNTLYMYFRMLLTMVVSLYTSRIVLEYLGVIDFGIYNVVAGIVVLFSVLSATMANSTQRFLSIQEGENEGRVIKKNIFSQFVILHILIACVVLLFAETVGLILIFEKLNIPADRYDAALIVYQLSVVVFIAAIMKAPYEAALITKENMKIYAYIGVFEALIKLLVAYSLMISTVDNLILYASLNSGVSLIICAYTFFYVIKIYPEFKFQYFWEGGLFIKIARFVGWNYLTAVGDVLRIQGLNIVLNLFFGPAVNAARGIAFLVQAALIKFVTGFQSAVNPRIVKLWAQNEKQKMIELMCQSSKFSFYLLLILSGPVIINSEFILKFWLKNPPEHAVEFIQLILIQSMIESLCYPMWTVIGAIGRLQFSHIAGSILYILIVIFSYFSLSFGGEPYLVFYISIIIMILIMFMLIFRINFLVGGFVKLMVYEIFLRPFLLFFPLIVTYFLIFNLNLNQDFKNFIATSIFLTLFQIIFIYFFGMTKLEKNFLKNFIKRKKNEHTI